MLQNVLSKLPLLHDKFAEGKDDDISETDLKNWVMGRLRNIAMGNVNLTELSKEI